jgi:hypothetical protein
MSETQALIVSHAERERRAYQEAIAHAWAGDKVAHARAWAEFVRLHSERPQAVVLEMERRKGLA